MPTIPVKTLLSTYQNLEKLWYEYPTSFDGSDAGYMVLGYTHPLKDLALLLNKLQDENFEDILRACPKLRSLSLKGCEADVLDLTLHYCCDLEKLEFNEESLDPELDIKDCDGDLGYVKITKEAEAESGLQDLAICTSDPFDFVRLFNKHSSTLRNMHITERLFFGHRAGMFDEQPAIAHHILRRRQLERDHRSLTDEGT